MSHMSAARLECPHDSWNLPSQRITVRLLVVSYPAALAANIPLIDAGAAIDVAVPDHDLGDPVSSA